MIPTWLTVILSLGVLGWLVYELWRPNPDQAWIDELEREERE